MLANRKNINIFKFIIMTEELLNETISVLESIEEDASMALDGRWDCTTEEGINTGFNAQITLINRVLPQLKSLKK
jgi:hypothetical protein